MYKNKAYLMAINHLSVTVCKKTLFASINNQDVYNKNEVQHQDLLPSLRKLTQWKLKNPPFKAPKKVK